MNNKRRVTVPDFISIWAITPHLSKETFTRNEPIHLSSLFLSAPSVVNCSGQQPDPERKPRRRDTEDKSLRACSTVSRGGGLGCRPAESRGPLRSLSKPPVAQCSSRDPQGARREEVPTSQAGLPAAAEHRAPRPLLPPGPSGQLPTRQSRHQCCPLCVCSFTHSHRVHGQGS